MMIETHWSDENMYICAGVLIQNHTLYKDFAFLQMPYLPFCYAIIYKLIGTTYYLLIAELVNFAFMAMSCLLIFLISHHFSKNIFVSSGNLLLFLFNDIIISTMSYSANTILPIAFSLLGFYLYIIFMSPNSINRLGIFFSGIAIAISIGTKLYYVATLPPFFIISLIQPKSLSFKKRIINGFIPLAAGIMIGLLPVFYYLTNDVDIFIFNNFGYHKLNTLYREITGYTRSMSTITKIYYGMRISKLPSNIALLIGIFFLFFTLSSEKKNIKSSMMHFIKTENLLLILLILFTTTASFTPTPLWLHYFALPFPYFVILVAFWYGHLTIPNKKLTQILICCLILVSLFGSGTALFRHVYQIFNPDKWTSLIVHKRAEQMKYYIGTVKNNQKVATLSPIFALEGGLPVYKELSTGTFIYRLGELLPERITNKYSYVSSQNIDELFEKDPPKAILVDLTGKYDFYKPFIKYAEEKNFKKIQKDLQGLILYVSPNE